MPELHTIVLTDIVESTSLNGRLGDRAMGQLWTAHDREARTLMRSWGALEIGRSDGFLLLFANPAHALGFADAYHHVLSRLDVPLQARIGIHFGPVDLRCNSDTDIQRGAPRHEIDGIALPLAARLMAAAGAAQTLVSAQCREALGSFLVDDLLTVVAPFAADRSGQPSVRLRLQNLGCWRFKGMPAPLQIYAVGADGSVFTPPPDSAKAYRVTLLGGEWVPARAVPHSLPAERDAFVGRDDVLAALALRFEQGARMVTLLGPGGVGKSRLSIRYARRWLGDHAGGAWFCDLSSAQSLEGVIHAVAQVLELPPDRNDPIKLIGDAIAGRGSCLLILDNFEQVAQHAEATLGAWLERAPEATFVVTSRERLGIVGEQALVLDPLNQCEAEELFRLRMAAACGHLSLSEADAAAVLPLVELLDHLPLAIELAAARMNVMQPAQLLSRMGERFKLLSVRGGRHARQSTLRATLDWSWELLTSSEKAALAQCSVFEGGFTLTAATSVLDLRCLDHDIAVVDALQGLVEKSLLRRVSPDRFNMLRSVLDYAAERLCESADGTRDAAMARHWRHFGSLDEQSAIAGRCIEVDNLVTACRRATAAGDIEGASAALVSAWAGLNLTGPLTVAIEMARALHGAALPQSIAVAMTARWVSGSACYLCGDIAAARSDLEEAASWPGADARHRARVCASLGQLERSLGRVPRAKMLLVEGLNAALEAADAGLICRAYNALGALSLTEGRLDDAYRLLSIGLEAALTARDLKQQAALIGNIGVVEYHRGRKEATMRHYEEALQLARDIGDRRFEGNMRSNLGLLHQENGQCDSALEHLQAALSIARRTGLLRLSANVCSNLGLVKESLGDYEGALAEHREAVRRAERLSDPTLSAHLSIYLGRCLVRLGRVDEAATCLDGLNERLTDCPDASVLGLFACARAEVAHVKGQVDLLQRCLEAALDNVKHSEPGTRSELVLAIQAIQARISSR